MRAEFRSRAQPRRDTEHRLTHDVDAWVASASADGEPYLVPLSFDWDGGALLLATPTDSPTGRNLAASRTVRLGLGHTRDVSMIDGEVSEIDALPQERGERFAARTGFDPRSQATPYRWFRILPRRIQAEIRVGPSSADPSSYAVHRSAWKGFSRRFYFLAREDGPSLPGHRPCTTGVYRIMVDFGRHQRTTCGRKGHSG